MARLSLLMLTKKDDSKPEEIPAKNESTIVEFEPYMREMKKQPYYLLITLRK